MRQMRRSEREGIGWFARCGLGSISVAEIEPSSNRRGSWYLLLLDSALQKLPLLKLERIKLYFAKLGGVFCNSAVAIFPNCGNFINSPFKSKNTIFVHD